MNLLVSDFDGTFDGINQETQQILNLEINKQKVREFIERGNLFVFATGASAFSLLSFAKEFQVPYHYIIGGDGILGNTELSYPYRYVTKCGYLKEDGIERILDQLLLVKDMEIDDENIFTIGDSSTDKKMIETWNGFQIGDDPVLKKVALGKYEEVYQLIDDINSGVVKKRAFSK